MLINLQHKSTGAHPREHLIESAKPQPVWCNGRRTVNIICLSAQLSIALRCTGTVGVCSCGCVCLCAVIDGFRYKQLVLWYSVVAVITPADSPLILYQLYALTHKLSVPAPLSKSIINSGSVSWLQEMSLRRRIPWLFSLQINQKFIEINVAAHTGRHLHEMKIFGRGG